MSYPNVPVVKGVDWERKTAQAVNYLLSRAPLTYGTVTSVSVVAANGFSGTVATATTTPAITLTLAAATPSTSGSMSAADKTKLDGVATGATANSTDAALRDRSTHTGTQASGTITTAATDRLLGRSSVGAGAVEEIVCTAAGRALIDDADAAAQRTTLGLGTAALVDTGTAGARVPLLSNATSAFSGDITVANLDITTGRIVTPVLRVEGTSANLIVKDTDSPQATMRAYVSFVDNTNTEAAQIGHPWFDGNLWISNNGGNIYFTRVLGGAASVTIDATGTTIAGQLTAPYYTVAARAATFTETATSGAKLNLCSGTMTANLPTAVGNKAILKFKLTAAGTLTIDAAGTETIDGALTATITTVQQAVSLYSDNANWHIA